MHKVVINAKYGGLVSTEAAKILVEQGMEDIEVDKDGWVLGQYDLCRHDPRLVEVVEKLGRLSMSTPASLLKLFRATSTASPSMTAEDLEYQR